MIPLDVYKHRSITAIVGKAGYGKSYFIKSLLYEDPANRIIVFDINCEYDFMVERGYEIFKKFSDFKEFILNNYDSDIKVIIQFDNLDDYELALELSYRLGSIIIVLEEVHQYSNAFATVKPLEKIIRFGRHHQVSLIAITHRFTDLSVLIRQNLDIVVFFRCSTANDVKLFKDYEYIEKYADKIAILKKQEYIICKNI